MIETRVYRPIWMFSSSGSVPSLICSHDEFAFSSGIFLLTEVFFYPPRAIDVFGLRLNFVCCGLWLAKVFNKIGKFQCAQNVGNCVQTNHFHLPCTFVLVGTFQFDFVLHFISILLSFTFRMCFFFPFIFVVFCIQCFKLHFSLQIEFGRFLYFELCISLSAFGKHDYSKDRNCELFFY